MALTGDDATMSGLNSTPAQRWLARLSFVLAGLAIVVLLVFAGLKSLAMLAVGLAAAVIGLAAAYFFLSRRGIWRWLSLAVFVLAPIAVIVGYATPEPAVDSGPVGCDLADREHDRAAGPGRGPGGLAVPEHPAQPPARHPYVIMNPKSGGGKVEKFDLKRRAEDLGAEVFLIGGPEPVDVAKVARDAVARRRRSARRRGRRRNAGLGGRDRRRARPAVHGDKRRHAQGGRPRPGAWTVRIRGAGLRALSDGVELHIDLGLIDGQTFVNNASFGAYAEVVETPAYRDDKLNTTLNTLPDLLQGHRGARLRAHADGTENRGAASAAGIQQPVRDRRYRGGLAGARGWTAASSVSSASRWASARQAAGLLHGRHAAGHSVLTTRGRSRSSPTCRGFRSVSMASRY